MKYRKKPVVIEAISWSELEDVRIKENQGKKTSFNYSGHQVVRNDDEFLIPTLEGTMTMNRGDMLITGVKGEIYPCKPDIFEATYDKVED